jgi:hypothetical protein
MPKMAVIGPDGLWKRPLTGRDAVPLQTPSEMHR